MEAYLAKNEKFFYNNIVEPNFVISSGSLKLDVIMGGGIRPGVIRLTGVTEGGKTNCALSFARNFLSTVENSFVVYFRAEGRLSDDILKRQGLLNHPRLKIVKGNVYEKVIDMMSFLIDNNQGDAHFFFIIDSADAMIPIGDVSKSSEEANKVSGGALLSADMLRKMANKFIVFGHICAIISQKRDQVVINQYAAKDPRVTNASGGNALLHYSDWILEFEYRYNKDIIYPGEDAKSGNPLGHICKVSFKKTPNEKSHIRVEYPIRYGRENGNSIWVEREIVDMLISFGFLTKKGSWFELAKEEVESLKQANLVFPEKIQGINQIISTLEENKTLSDYFYKRLSSLK
jgi:RecA/RadA recombinase